MTANIDGVSLLGGTSDNDCGGNCYVCGNNRAARDLNLLVNSKDEGDILVGIFNTIVHKCAWFDYHPFAFTHIQVKIHSCDTHFQNLQSLRERILQIPVINEQRSVSAAIIEQSRVG